MPVLLPRGATTRVARPGFAASPYSHFVVAEVVASICRVSESVRFVVGSYVQLVVNPFASVHRVGLFFASYAQVVVKRGVTGSSCGPWSESRLPRQAASKV